MDAYTTGRTAKELRSTPHKVRRWCASGQLEGSIKDPESHHWRVPVAAVEQFKKRRLPQVPVVAADPPPGRHSITPRPSDGLLAEPSEDAIESRDKLLKRRDQVALAKLDGDMADQVDRRQERRRRKDAALAADQAEQQRQVVEAQREEWTEDWIDQAFQLASDDLPSELRLPVAEQVRAALDQISPSCDHDTTEWVVGAVVDKILRPWRERQRQVYRNSQAAEQRSRENELRLKVLVDSYRRRRAKEYRQRQRQDAERVASNLLRSLPQDLQCWFPVDSQGAHCVAGLIRKDLHAQLVERVLVAGLDGTQEGTAWIEDDSEGWIRHLAQRLFLAIGNEEED